MSNVISLETRRHLLSADMNTDNVSELPSDIHHLAALTETVDGALSRMSDEQPIAQAVALAAGRYAAMQLFQSHGRAYAMSFFDDCIATSRNLSGYYERIGRRTQLTLGESYALQPL